MSFKEFLNESSYEVYHNSLTSAVQAAEKFANKNGFELDDEEMADKIGLGPAKPSPGKTNKYTLTLYKNGKEQKKALHFQVFNRETSSNPFELNAYIL